MFTPTDAEWATWPEMCKAPVFAHTHRSGSDFGTSVPQSVVQQWEAQLGPGWNYVHHHCAGMIYLDRAKLESEPQPAQVPARHARSPNTASRSSTRPPTIRSPPRSARVSV